MRLWYSAMSRPVRIAFPSRLFARTQSPSLYSSAARAAVAKAAALNEVLDGSRKASRNSRSASVKKKSGNRGKTSALLRSSRQALPRRFAYSSQTTPARMSQLARRPMQTAVCKQTCDRPVRSSVRATRMFLLFRASRDALAARIKSSAICSTAWGAEP